MMPHSRLAVFSKFFIISIKTPLHYRVTSFPSFGRVRWVSFYFITSVIPGLSPSNFVTGRAFTSKVFRSYCPLLFVAFHTA